MSFHPYESCGGCAGSSKPATRYIMEALIVKYPYVRSMGIYSCRDVAGTSTFSIHACGRAGDTGIPTLSGGGADTSKGHPPLRDLIDNAGALGITGCIYNRLRYDAKSPGGRYYGGVHPHYDHIHWEQTDSHSRNLTRSEVFAILDSTGSEYLTMLAPCKKGDKGEHVAALQVMLRSAGFAAQVGEVDGVYGDQTSAAVLAMRQSQGSTATSGDAFEKWGHEQLLAAHIKAKVQVTGGGLSKAEADKLYQPLGTIPSHGHKYAAIGHEHKGTVVETHEVTVT